MNDPQRLQTLKDFYQQLNRSTLSRNALESLYAESAVLIDPFRQIDGLDELYLYFRHLYQSVEEIRFTYGPHISDDHYDFLHWQMDYRHPAIGKGKQISLRGGSSLQWQDGRIIRHEDFFDAGQMLYEHLPLLGYGIRKIRERLL
jgi:hypothetical protein